MIKVDRVNGIGYIFSIYSIYSISAVYLFIIQRIGITPLNKSVNYNYNL